MTKVEKVGEATRLRVATIDDGLAKLDNKDFRMGIRPCCRVRFSNATGTKELKQKGLFRSFSGVHQRKGSSYIR